jgi:hypothetical protein
MTRLKQFLRALYSAWGSGLTGSASAPLVVLAFMLKEAWMKTTSATFAALCLVAATFLVWEREKEQVETLEARFKGLPFIRLAPEGFYADTRPLQINETIAPTGEVVRFQLKEMRCVRARFVNDPVVPTPDGVANDVVGTVEFFDASGERLCFMDGRWADTDQPQPGTSTVQLLAVNIPIGQTREMDIAFKFPDDEDCYGVNNDSYRARDFKDQRWKLSGSDFYAVIRLRAPYIDKRWRFHFRNPGAGNGLQALEVEEI